MQQDEFKFVQMSYRSSFALLLRNSALETLTISKDELKKLNRHCYCTVF